MTVFAPTPLTSRQVIVRGRVSQAVTQGTPAVVGASLSYAHGPGGGPLPVSLETKPGGYFALHLDVARQMPDLSNDGPVRLELTLAVEGHDPLTTSATFPAARFARIERPVTIAGQTLVSHAVAGAPFVLDLLVPATPVGLRGIVIKDHDPEAPLPGVKVRAGAAPEVLTAANGRFTIAALPVVETMDIQLQGAGPAVTVPFRPDYEIPVNTITLSLPN